MRTLFRLALLFSLALAAHAQLDETCTVAVLNRTARVDERGFWQLPNVPSNLGPVRARATCVRDGRTVTGVSDLFVIPRDGIRFAPEIRFTAPAPVPASMILTASRVTLGAAGDTAQLEAVARNADGGTRDVTAGSEGTSYTTSNPAVVTVSDNGIVTATGNGLAIVSATNEGAFALLSLAVGGPADSDGDGIPDDIERSLGLDPNDPTDAAADPDGDGLTNLREYQVGTDLRNADTDGDGIGDGLEVQLGTDPLDPRSFDLARALRRVDVSPALVVLRPNRLFGQQATQQLTVTGQLLDGATIDLTSTGRGTNYQSSDLSVCNFGDRDGELFAGAEGSCTITVSSNGFTVAVPVTVYSIRAEALGVLNIPGYANNVKVRNGYAFVVAGNAGLQVVDARNPGVPAIVASLPLAGTAIDLRIRDDFAYIAAGDAGMHVVRISSPTSPQLVATVDTPGVAQDVWIDGTRAYVADGFAGMQIIDVANPLQPSIVGSLAAATEIKALSLSGTLAVLVTGDNQIIIVDVSQPATPRSIGTTLVFGGPPKDVVTSGPLVYVAAFNSGLQIIDFSDPASPRTVGGTGFSFVPRDLVARGTTLLFADQLYSNAVPFVTADDPANPVFRDILDLSSLGDYAGTGIDADAELVYVTGELFIVSQDFGASGNTALMIGRYDQTADLGGIAPTVRILSPTPDQAWVNGARETIVLSATDDVAVDRVTIAVNGETFDVRDPFRATYIVPFGIDSVTIAATAFDTGGNAATAPTITIPVTPDPLTTVRGTVRTSDGAAVSGAAVALDALSTTTDAAGMYEFTGVGTLTGDFTVIATALVGGTPLTGRVMTAPVRGGITAIDITIGPLPVGIISSIDFAGANGIDVRDNLVALAIGFEGGGSAVRSNSESRGLELIDITNPLAPSPRGSVSLPGLPSDVRLTATRAYVATRETGVQIVDIADPSTPTVIGSLPDSSGAVSLALNASTLYVAAGAHGLVIYDLSGPSPQVRSTMQFARAVNKVVVSGTLLAVNEEAASIGGILRDSSTYLIDVTNPSAPAILGSVVTEHDPRSLAIVDGKLYVADNILYAFDITSPANPLPLPSPLSGFDPWGVAGAGARLVVTGIDSQTQDIAAVIDLDRSTRLTDVAFPNPGGSIGGAVALAPPFAIVSTVVFSQDRLFILKYTTP